MRPVVQSALNLKLWGGAWLGVIPSQAKDSTFPAKQLLRKQTKTIKNNLLKQKSECPPPSLYENHFFDNSMLFTWATDALIRGILQII